MDRLPAALFHRRTDDLGKQRFGKSNFLFWQILEDIKNGQGVTVMDGKGEK